MVWWTEETLRKIAAEEAVRILAGPAGRKVLMQVVETLLHGEALSKLNDAARQEASQLAQELGQPFARLIEQQKEEAKRLITAQKSLATRQINEHIDGVKASAASAMRAVETRAEADLREVERRLRTRSEEFERQVTSRLEGMIESRLREAILDAARQFVQETPVVERGLSNREIASANGISLRAAKRLRRANFDGAVNTSSPRPKRRSALRP